MDRLISEQAVIDRLTRWYSDMLETGKEQEDLIEVIKAIPSAEPSDVLDKIRDEIEQIEINGYIRDVECFSTGINTALNVINKYRKEVSE